MTKSFLSKWHLIALIGAILVGLSVSSCQVSPDNSQNGVDTSKSKQIAQNPFSDGTKAGRSYVTLYKDCFSGESVSLYYGNNVPDFAYPYGTFNNAISSIKCFNGAAVVLYDGANYTGNSRMFSDDYKDFYYLNFNDVTSSLKWLGNTVMTKIAAGYGFSMAIRADCYLYATGLNADGQLGTGNYGNKNGFVRVLGNVKAVACGRGQTLALKWDGTLWATGDNRYGQLGKGDNNSTCTFTQVMSGVSAISCGYLHSFALKSDGTLWATGYNGTGQLGTGDNTSVNSFVQVMSGVSAVSAGNNHSLALKTDATVWATGYNGYGELGTGNNISVNTFVQVMSGARAITCGDNFSLVLKSRTLYATGDNYYGQLGLNDNNNRNSFTYVNGYSLRAIASQSIADHSMALWNDGTVQTAGWNYNGQLGTGDRTDRKIFVQVASGASVIACGYDHSLIIKNDGTLWAVGNNYSGQLGLYDNNLRVYFTQVAIY